MTLKVACYGSCITRDNFNSKLNKNYKQKYEVVATSMHASLISLTTPKIAFDATKLDYVEEGNKTEGKKRIAIEDLNKSFMEDLKVSKPDYLIMDFFPDIYFGVVFSKDRIFTNNHWYICNTNYYKELPEKFVLKIEKNLSDYLSIWLPAFSEFMDYLAENVPNCEVIINKGRFGNRFLDEGDDASLPSLDRYNEIWKRIDNFLISKYGFKYIELDHSKYFIARKPTLGGDVFQLHYQDNYYHDFLEQLNRIIQPDVSTNV